MSNSLKRKVARRFALRMATATREYARWENGAKAVASKDVLFHYFFNMKMGRGKKERKADTTNFAVEKVKGFFNKLFNRKREVR